ncbi:Canalicular multispecific organic anion transporter 2 [Chionoecetes opilio]|uniref:Canalicular multispecific organic anion transporter 2 n=1 Tax=Chionoecetes opilio TaxID=41210 RepID=A0A8J4XKH3_CHIOP|nr:Canalicular multispecific organic anion transporter 2 [Chionoecetes opilio]
MTSDVCTFPPFFGIKSINSPFPSVFPVVAILTLAVGTLQAAGVHSGILTAVIHLPMSFVDTKPSGRIMKPLCQEMTRWTSSSWIIRSFITTLLRVRPRSVYDKLVVIIATTPLCPPGSAHHELCTVASASICDHFRQLMRLESVSSRPIYSHFSESKFSRSLRPTPLVAVMSRSGAKI